MSLALGPTMFLLLVAVLVALFARRLRLPYTVGLVLAGAGLAFLHLSTGLKLTHEFVFDVILPPLLFEAALNIHWSQLRRDLTPVLVLATLGVLISALFVSWGMHAALAWPWSAALLFGILIAATDPVAVIAMFKDTGVTGRLRLLVESESLLNDGVAAVLFALALGWAQAAAPASVTAASVAGTLALTVGGGIFVGALCGGFALLLAGSTLEYLVEAALTTVTAYGSFIVAEQLHVSGVLATVTAGMLMGNIGLLRARTNDAVSERGRMFVLELWEFIAFLANSLIFLLIGLSVATISFHALGWLALLVAIALVLAGRAAAVYPLCALFARSDWKIGWKQQHVLWWGGLRGALALALALSLPNSLRFHDAIVIATFGVVAFSVLAQGLTMPVLLKFLRLLPKRKR